MFVREFFEQRVRPVLRDDQIEGGQLWTDGELLAYLNEGLAELVQYRPEASSKTVVHALQAGALQRIPEYAYSLMEVLCNVDVKDKFVGSSIRRAERVTLDIDDPSWMSQEPQTLVRRFVYDRANQGQFLVYPPNNGEGRVSLTVAITPTLVCLDDEIPVDAIYLPTIAIYMLYKAYDKLSEDPTLSAKSQAYGSTFYNKVGAYQTIQESKSAQVFQPLNPTIIGEQR